MSHSKLDGFKNTAMLSEDNFGLLNFADPEAANAPNWQNSFPDIIGRSEPMKEILKQVAKVSRSDCNILIRGESGTGKELIAKSVHRLSNRANKQFVAINCSAIAESLLESELFGHVKGAFTGAVQTRAGLFESASGGTLFLDEIGDMPMSLQAKLLRVLQEKQYTPVGGTNSKKVDVRIVVATNVDLEKAVQEMRFRLDLFYRLNVIPLELTPLRERQEDVTALVDYFLNVSNNVHRPRDPIYFSDESMAELRRYAWPGNVRELQNLIERLVVTSNSSCIEIGDLPLNKEYSDAEFRLESSPATSRTSAASDNKSMPLTRAGGQAEVSVPAEFGSLPDSGIDLPKFIEQLENNLILQALGRTKNNKNQAAKLLGINRTTLVERIKKRKIGAINQPTRD